MTTTGDNSIEFADVKERQGPVALHRKLRDPSIELWRCFCMFMVVFSHVMYNNHLSTFNWFMWHIPGFLIISGWFGIHFTWKRVFGLVGITYACFWLTVPFRIGDGDTFLSFLIPHGGWFLPFYCLLMLFAPILNAAIENKKHLKAITTSTIVLVVVGWVPLLSLNAHLARLRVAGMQGHGLLLMIGIYLLARIAREYKVDKCLAEWLWAVLFLSGCVCCGVIGNKIPGSVCYASPIAIATAFAGFFAFRGLKIHASAFRSAICFIAPSMFSVYLIHECCLKKFQYMPQGHGALWAVMLAIILFAGSVGIDLARRGGGEVLVLDNEVFEPSQIII